MAHIGLGMVQAAKGEQRPRAAYVQASEELWSCMGSGGGEVSSCFCTLIIFLAFCVINCIIAIISFIHIDVIVDTCIILIRKAMRIDVRKSEFDVGVPVIVGSIWGLLLTFSGIITVVNIGIKFIATLMKVVLFVTGTIV